MSKMTELMPGTSGAKRGIFVHFVTSVEAWMQNTTLHWKCQARGTVCQLFLSLALSAEHSEIDVAHLFYKYAKIYIFHNNLLFFFTFHNHDPIIIIVRVWRSNVVLVRHWSREPIKLVDTEKLKPNNNNNTGIVSHVMSHNKNNHFLLSRARKQLD